MTEPDYEKLLEDIGQNRGFGARNQNLKLIKAFAVRVSAAARKAAYEQEAKDCECGLGDGCPWMMKAKSTEAAS